MKTIVIAISGLEYNDNFKVFPPTFALPKLDVKVVLHNDPKVTSYGNTVLTNYDLLIDATPDMCNSGLSDLSEVTTYYKLRRSSKSLQSAILTKIKSRIKDPKFKVPERYDLEPCHGWMHGLPVTSKRVMLKVPNGARGIGQCIVEVNDGYTLHSLVSDYVKHISDKVEEEFQTDKGVIHHLKGLEHKEGESMDHLKISINKVDVCEYIEDVTEEWRVWTDLDCNPYIVGKRSLDERVGGYKQATYIKEDDDIKNLPKELPKLLKLLKLEQMSVDVFRTANGEWGLFEWQPQTGFSSVEASKVYDWHVKFISDLIERLLPVK